MHKLRASVIFIITVGANFLYIPDMITDLLEKTSAVVVSDVRFIGVTGSSTSEVAVNLKCSQNAPCTGIVMDSVNLWSADKGKQVQSYCFNAQGTKRNLVAPDVPCLTSEAF